MIKKSFLVSSVFTFVTVWQLVKADDTEMNLPQALVDCGKDLKMNVDPDMMHKEYDKSKFLEHDMLCLFYCAAKKLGNINGDQLVNHNKMIESVSMGPYSIEDKRKESTLACLKGTGKIEACDDFKKVVYCLRSE